MESLIWKKFIYLEFFLGNSSYGIVRDAETCGDVIGYAVDNLIEDQGEIKMNIITNHFSSGENWCKHDMGITSDWSHDVYDTMYPDGYELIWLGCFNSDKEVYDVVVEKLNT